jgi:hypothetical protein
LNEDIVEDIGGENRGAESVIRDDKCEIRESFIREEWEEDSVVEVIKLFLYTS